MIQGLLLGLSTTLSCAVVCGPILISFLLTKTQSKYIPIINFMIGRFVAYMAFGFLSGYTGVYFEGRIDPLIFHSVMILLSLWLILYALGTVIPHNPICSIVASRNSGKFFPFFAGLVFGLNICPPFLLAMGQTIAYASVIKSLVFFVGFFIGSSMWVIILVAIAQASQVKVIQRIGKVCALGVGLWYLVTNLAAIIRFI